MAYLIIWQRNIKFLVLTYHKYKETEGIKCVEVSSFVGNPLSILQ